MTQLQKARALRRSILNRTWDLEYCELVTQLFVCAGLKERLAVFVVSRIFKSRINPYV